jgi:hypothetical protein
MEKNKLSTVFSNVKKAWSTAAARLKKCVYVCSQGRIWQRSTKITKMQHDYFAYFAIHAGDSFDPLATPAKQPGFRPLKADILCICITH